MVDSSYCEHGQLRRQCPQCEFDKENRGPRREQDQYREDPPVPVAIEIEQPRKRRRKPTERSTRNG